MKDSARQLLETIEDSFARFEIEFGTRRMVLSERYQLFRLSKHYHDIRRRFLQRYGRPPRRSVSPIGEDRSFADSFLQFADGNDRLPISNSSNADICLRHHPLLAGIIGLDLRSNKTMLKAALPLDFWEFSEFEMRPFTKGDVTSVQQFLQTLGLITIERADVEAAIQRIARENAWRRD